MGPKINILASGVIGSYYFGPILTCKLKNFQNAPEAKILILGPIMLLKLDRKVLFLNGFLKR